MAKVPHGRLHALFYCLFKGVVAVRRTVARSHLSVKLLRTYTYIRQAISWALMQSSAFSSYPYDG